MYCYTPIFLLPPKIFTHKQFCKCSLALRLCYVVRCYTALCIVRCYSMCVLKKFCDNKKNIQYPFCIAQLRALIDNYLGLYTKWQDLLDSQRLLLIRNLIICRNACIRILRSIVPLLPIPFLLRQIIIKIILIGFFLTFSQGPPLEIILEIQTVIKYIPKIKLVKSTKIIQALLLIL